MNLLGDGLVLLVLGMGMVFVFLAVMVGMMTLSAKFVAKYAHLFPEEPVPAPRKRTPKNAPADDTDLIAVLSAAIHRYRNDNR